MAAYFLTLVEAPAQDDFEINWQMLTYAVDEKGPVPEHAAPYFELGAIQPCDYGVADTGSN